MNKKKYRDVPPINSFSFSKSYLKTNPTHTTCQTFTNPSNLTNHQTIHQRPSSTQRDKLNERLQAILKRYQNQRRKELRLLALYDTLPQVIPLQRKRKKQYTTKIHQDNAISTSSNIINIVNNVNTRNPDKKIDLKMNINQYDIKCYVRSNSKIDLMLSDINTNQSQIKNTKTIKNKKMILQDEDEEEEGIFEVKVDKNNRRQNNKTMNTMKDNYDTIDLLINGNKTVDEDDNNNRLRLNKNNNNKKNTNITQQSYHKVLSFNDDNGLNKQMINTLKFDDNISDACNRNSSNSKRGNLTSNENEKMKRYKIHYSPISKYQTNKRFNSFQNRKKLIKTTTQIISINQSNINNSKEKVDQSDNAKLNSFTQAENTKAQTQTEQPTESSTKIQSYELSSQTKKLINQVQKFNSFNTSLLSQNQSQVEDKRYSMNPLQMNLNDNIKLNNTKRDSDNNNNLQRNNPITSRLSYNKNNPVQLRRDSFLLKQHTFKINTNQKQVINDNKLNRHNTLFATFKPQYHKTILNKQSNIQINEKSLDESIQSDSQIEAEQLTNKIFKQILQIEQFDELLNQSYSYMSDSDNCIKNQKKNFLDDLKKDIKKEIIIKNYKTQTLTNNLMLQNIKQTYYARIQNEKIKKLQTILFNEYVSTNDNNNEKNVLTEMNEDFDEIDYILKEPYNIIPYQLRNMLVVNYYDIYNELSREYLHNLKMTSIKVGRKNTISSVLMSLFNMSIQSNVSPMEQYIAQAMKRTENMRYINEFILRELREVYNTEHIKSNNSHNHSLDNITLRRSYSYNRKSPKNNLSNGQNCISNMKINEFTVKRSKKKNIVFLSKFNILYNDKNKENTSMQSVKNKKSFNNKKKYDFNLPNRIIHPCNKETKRGIRKQKVKRMNNIIKKSKTRMIFKTTKHFLKHIDNKKDNLNKKIMMLIRDNNSVSLWSIFREKINNININYQDEKGNTFLHCAVLSNSIDVCQFVIEKGCLVDEINKEHNTALHLALSKQFYLIVNLLIKFKANEKIVNLLGLTPWECVGLQISKD